MREVLTPAVQRGKLNVLVNLAEPDNQANGTSINEVAARKYYRQLIRLKKELNLAGEITISDLLRFPDIVAGDQSEPDLDALWKVVQKTVTKALKSLVAMRAREGKTLVADMRQRLKTMSTTLLDVEKATEGATLKYADRLAARVEELLNGHKLDPSRLEEEIALFADRTDIAEECTRFRSHIDQFMTTLKQKDAVGRRLNFILQELNREVNTIGSKGSAFDISANVISLKEEIEKLREQVQNLE
jgi:uncharacterized protein (TIGR00255 family)